MKKEIFVSVLFLAITSCSFSQIAGNAVYNNSSSNLSDGVNLDLRAYGSQLFSTLLEANVMINVKAEAYTAIFSLTQNGSTIEEAENNMRSRVDQFKKALEQANISPRQIFIDPVSLVPAYETEVEKKRFSKTVNEVPAGFEMKKNVHITFTDHDQINQIIMIAAKAEVYDLVKVDYSINDMEAVLAGIRQEALKILMEKKEAIEKTGIHIRFTRTGEKYGSVYPFERYTQYYAYKTGASPVITVNYKKGEQVQYNYAEKNKTIYYEKIADKQFDQVVNPVVGEPMVQIYISVKAEYSIYNPETEAADKIYNQKMRELQIKEMELRLEAQKSEIEIRKKTVTK